MINEQPDDIKQGGKPANHKNDVQRFYY